MTNPGLASAPMSIGHFRVQGTLGFGTGHVLYQAVDNRTGARVALKCSLPGREHQDLEPSLKGEWEAAQRLTQPGIQRVLEMTQEDGVGTYLVLESLEGTSLASLIVQGVPTFHGLHLLVQLLHVLESAERDGLLHGDLRPENLWISPTGTLLVLGFGSTNGSEADTRPGPAADSAHTAPERLHGAPPSPSSELFALAVTAFQVLTGHLPFGKSAEGAKDPADLERALKFPVDMPMPMQRVFSKALDPQPENRYTSLHGFISVLIASSPLKEDRLEALLAFVDGASIPVDFTGLLPPDAARKNDPLGPRDTQPLPIQIPVEERDHQSSVIRASTQVPRVLVDAASPDSHAEARTRIEGFVKGLPGVLEFAIYSQGETPEATSHTYGTLRGILPSFYLQMADSIHDPESLDSVRAITIKSQKRGSIILFRRGPFSIALLLKPGKNAKGILEELRTLQST